MKIIFFFMVIILVACDIKEKKGIKNIEENTITINIQGEVLFKANCASCHKVDEEYIGPALQGVASRWESKELLYAFIRNSQDVIGRNTYAKLLFEKYKQSPMLPYPQLSNDDIDNILKYCGEDTLKTIACIGTNH